MFARRLGEVTALGEGVGKDSGATLEIGPKLWVETKILSVEAVEVQVSQTMIAKVVNCVDR